MIVLKYAKRFPLNLVSHVDMLNVVKRIFLRAGVKVGYSVGFNPHMLLFFSPALSLGIESECEYVCAAAEYTDGLEHKLNAFAPEGFECLKVFPTQNDPGLSAKSYAARYLFEVPGIGAADTTSLAGNPDFQVAFKDKEGEKIKSAGEKIYMLAPRGEDALEAVLACGNNNLRADRVLKQICLDFCLDFDSAKITKTELLLDGALPADEYLVGRKKI